MSNIITDACFWIALIRSDDYFHQKSLNIIRQIEDKILFLPWPVLYETLRTKTVRYPERVKELEIRFSRSNFVFLDDSKYREVSLKKIYSQADIGERIISLVDMIIREIIIDIRVKVDFLVTFNDKDFYDVCRLRKIQIISA